MNVQQRLKFKIAELTAKRDAIDAQIVALRVAVRVLNESHHPVKPKRRRDSKARSTTLQVVEHRRRPLTVPAAAKAMKVTARVASQRLRKLVLAGQIRRVERGKYMALPAPRSN